MRKLTGSIHDAIVGADVFIGVSAPNVIDGSDVAKMNPGAVVFALANPDPEIDPLEAQAHAAVVATGRSDFPNQINNVLAFPGVFRGLLDAQATEITDEMLIAAAEAIANVVSPEQLNASYIVPSVFDENVSKAVARAIVGARERARPDGRRRQGIGAAVSGAQFSQSPAPVPDPAPALTHVDASGAARMVDVSGKQPTDQDGAGHRRAAHHRRGGAVAAAGQPAEG